MGWAPKTARCTADAARERSAPCRRDWNQEATPSSRQGITCCCRPGRWRQIVSGSELVNKCNPTLGVRVLPSSLFAQPKANGYLRKLARLCRLLAAEANVAQQPLTTSNRPAKQVAEHPSIQATVCQSIQAYRICCKKTERGNQG